MLFYSCTHIFKRDTWMADTIFSEDAVEIGTVILNGETKGIIDIKDVLHNGMTPLHLAAAGNSPRLIKFLLERGYSSDVLCDSGGMNLKQADWNF